MGHAMEASAQRLHRLAQIGSLLLRERTTSPVASWHIHREARKG